MKSPEPLTATATETEPRAPDWRWWAAKNSHHQDEDAADQILREAREFCTALDDPTVRSRAIVRKHPDLSVAYSVHGDTYQYSLRWLIELYITAGWANARISAELEGTITERQIELYRRLFYDIGAHLQDPEYMERYVLKSVQRQRDPYGDSSETDFYYKHGAGNLPFLMACTGLPGHASMAITRWRGYPVEYWLACHRRGYE